jgi:hypothetical protein
MINTNIDLELLLIIFAFIGISLVIFQLLRIKQHVGWIPHTDIGGILTDYTLFWFSWLCLLSSYVLARRIVDVQDALRDNIILFLLISLIIIVYSMAYRIHRWFWATIREAERRDGSR